MNEEIINDVDSIEMKPERRSIHLTFVSVGAFLLITLLLLVLLDMFIVYIGGNLAIVHAGIGEEVIDDPIPLYIMTIRIISILSLTLSIWFGLLGQKIYLHKPGRILQKFLVISVIYLAFIMFGAGIGVIITFSYFLWAPKRLADWDSRSLNIYRGGLIGIVLSIMIGEIVLGVAVGILAFFAIYFWNPELVEDWTNRTTITYFVGAIGVAIAFLLHLWVLGLGIAALVLFHAFFWNPMQFDSMNRIVYRIGFIGIILALFAGAFVGASDNLGIFGIGVSIPTIFGIFFWNPKQFTHWSSRELSIYRVGFIGVILAVMFGQWFIGFGIGLLMTFSIFMWNPEFEGDWKTRTTIAYWIGAILVIALTLLDLYGLGLGVAAIILVHFVFCNWFEKDFQITVFRIGFIGILFEIMLALIPLSATSFLVVYFDVIILLVFAGFFWNPKPVAEWNEIDLTIFRTSFGGIFSVVILAEMALFGGNDIYRFLQQLLMTPLSNVFTTIGVVIVTLGPALLLVIPLYLFLPKILRDLWNMRPSIESFWKEFLYHPMGIIGIIIIGTIVLVAIFAPWIAPYDWFVDPNEPILLENLLQPPSPEHLLGTNSRGEDIFSRILYGSQISLIIGFAASIVAVFLGTTVGLLSGYYGGIMDAILMRITDVFLCLPTLPLMLIFLMFFGQGLQNIIIVIAILGWTGTARMVRSEALSLRERPLTEAAHALGASDGYILIHHILPNTLPLILANMILGVVTAILSEAGIAFLGFVDIHGQPSWGIILHWAWKNAALLANKWWWFIPPGVLIMLTTLGFVFISHTADKVVNPRLRGRR